MTDNSAVWKALQDQIDAAEGARKLAETRLAAAKAEQALPATGSVLDSGLTGNVNVGMGAGGGEASLLAATAVERIAKKIVDAIKGAGLDTKRRWLIFQGTQAPTLDLWTLLRLKAAIITAARSAAAEAMQQADVASQKVSIDGGVNAVAQIGGFAAATAAGAAIETASKLGSYLQSDYQVGVVGPSGVNDDLLSVALAGQLKCASIPSRWALPPPQELSALISRLSQGLDDAQAARAVSAQRDIELRQMVASDADLAEELKRQASLYSQATARLDGAIKAADDALAWLASTDASGAAVMGKVAQQAAIQKALDDGALAILVHVTSLGGYYTKKNLWTFLGSMPFFVMGGAIASFMISGADGELRLSGNVSVHSGYHTVKDVALKFDAAKP